MSDIVERLAEFNQADIVDRLKQLADIEYVGSEYLAAAAEIERLRGLSGDLMAERNECREERERLRLEHGRCLAELGRWPSTRGELTAEIERMRDILRECDLALSFMPQPTKTLRALRERIKEALGEWDDQHDRMRSGDRHAGRRTERAGC